MRRENQRGENNSEKNSFIPSLKYLTQKRTANQHVRSPTALVPTVTILLPIAWTLGTASSSPAGPPREPNRRTRFVPSGSGCDLRNFDHWSNRPRALVGRPPRVVQRSHHDLDPDRLASDCVHFRQDARLRKRSQDSIEFDLPERSRPDLNQSDRLEHSRLNFAMRRFRFRKGNQGGIQLCSLPSAGIQRP